MCRLWDGADAEGAPVSGLPDAQGCPRCAALSQSVREVARVLQETATYVERAPRLGPVELVQWSMLALAFTQCAITLEKAVRDANESQA